MGMERRIFTETKIWGRGLRLVSVWLVLGLSTGSVTHPLLAADWYVSPTGSDLDGGSVGVPWRTLTHALDPNSGVVSGDTIHLFPGLYDAISDANGLEAFPLSLLDGVAIESLDPNNTAISAPQGTALFFATGDLSSTTRISGLTLRHDPFDPNNPATHAGEAIFSFAVGSARMAPQIVGNRLMGDSIDPDEGIVVRDVASSDGSFLGTISGNTFQNLDVGVHVTQRFGGLADDFSPTLSNNSFTATNRAMGFTLGTTVVSSVTYAGEGRMSPTVSGNRGTVGTGFDLSVTARGGTTEIAPVISGNTFIDGGITLALDGGLMAAGDLLTFSPVVTGNYLENSLGSGISSAIIALTGGTLLSVAEFSNNEIQGAWGRGITVTDSSFHTGEIALTRTFKGNRVENVVSDGIQYRAFNFTPVLDPQDPNIIVSQVGSAAVTLDFQDNVVRFAGSDGMAFGFLDFDITGAFQATVTAVNNRIAIPGRWGVNGLVADIASGGSGTMDWSATGNTIEMGISGAFVSEIRNVTGDAMLTSNLTVTGNHIFGSSVTTTTPALFSPAPLFQTAAAGADPLLALDDSLTERAFVAGDGVLLDQKTLGEKPASGSALGGRLPGGRAPTATGNGVSLYLLGFHVTDNSGGGTPSIALDWRAENNVIPVGRNGVNILQSDVTSPLGTGNLVSNLTISGNEMGQLSSAGIVATALSFGDSNTPAGNSVSFDWHFDNNSIAQASRGISMNQRNLYVGGPLVSDATIQNNDVDQANSMALALGWRLVSAGGDLSQNWRVDANHVGLARGTGIKVNESALSAGGKVASNLSVSDNSVAYATTSTGIVVSVGMVTAGSDIDFDWNLDRNRGGYTYYELINLNQSMVQSGGNIVSNLSMTGNELGETTSSGFDLWVWGFTTSPDANDPNAPAGDITLAWNIDDNTVDWANSSGVNLGFTSMKAAGALWSNLSLSGNRVGFARSWQGFDIYGSQFQARGDVTATWNVLDNWVAEAVGYSALRVAQTQWSGHGAVTSNLTVSGNLCDLVRTAPAIDLWARNFDTKADPNNPAGDNITFNWDILNNTVGYGDRGMEVNQRSHQAGGKILSNLSVTGNRIETSLSSGISILASSLDTRSFQPNDPNDPNNPLGMSGGDIEATWTIADNSVSTLRADAIRMTRSNFNSGTGIANAITVERNQVQGGSDGLYLQESRFIAANAIGVLANFVDNIIGIADSTGIAFFHSDFVAGTAIDSSAGFSGNRVASSMGSIVAQQAAFASSAGDVAATLSMTDNELGSSARFAAVVFQNALMGSGAGNVVSNVTMTGNQSDYAASNGVFLYGISFVASDGDIEASWTIQDNTLAQADTAGLGLAFIQASFSATDGGVSSTVEASGNSVDGGTIGLIGLGSDFSTSGTAPGNLKVDWSMLGNPVSHFAQEGILLDLSTLASGADSGLSMTVAGNDVSNSGSPGSPSLALQINNFSATGNLLAGGQVLNNQVQGSRGQGLFVSARNIGPSASTQPTLTVSGNTITGGAGDGIVVSSTVSTPGEPLQGTLLIRGNQVTDNAGAGLVTLLAAASASGSILSDVRLEENILQGNQAAGLRTSLTHNDTTDPNDPNAPPNTGSNPYLVSCNTITGNRQGIVQESNHYSFVGPPAVSIDYPTADYGGGNRGSVGLNVISGSTLYDFFNVSALAVMAQNNLWSDTAGVLIDHKIRDDDEDPTKGAVDYAGFLSTAPTVEANAQLVATLLTDTAPTGPSIGDTFQLDTTVSSTGSCGCANVVLSIPIPATETVVPGSVTVTSGTGLVLSENPITVAFGSLAASTSSQVSFQMTHDSGSSFSLQGTVSCAQLTSDVLTDDPNDSTSNADPTVVDFLPGDLGIALTAYSVSEAAGGVTATLSRSGGNAGSVTVDYELLDGTAVGGSDYTVATGTITWPEGDLTDKTLDLGILDDTSPEGDETFTLHLLNPTGGAGLLTDTATITIIDDDSAISLVSADWSAPENAGSITVTLTRTGATAGGVTVDYLLANLDATAPDDYVAATGTLVWADGETGDKSIAITLTDDALLEGDENLLVTFESPVAGSGTAVFQGESQVIATILDDESALRFSSATYAAGENSGPAVISVSRIGGSVGTVSVNYATSDGTAIAPTDYQAVAGTLVWADGETGDKTFSVPLVDDTDDEQPGETVQLTLTNPARQGLLGTPSSAELTIVDNDAPVGNALLRFSAPSYAVGETAGTALITVSRLDSTVGAVSVDYATSDGTAVSPGDYQATSGTLSWSDGEGGDKSFSVSIVDDTLFEQPGETVQLTLSNPTGTAVLGSPSAVELTIVDNERATPVVGHTTPGSRLFLVFLLLLLGTAFLSPLPKKWRFGQPETSARLF